MSRSWRLFLQGIEEAAARVERRTQGRGYEQFVADEVLYDAVVRNLETIGEAVKGLPASVRAQAPSIDWQRVAGLRDILAHSYFAIDNPTRWDVIRNKVPHLLAEVRRLLAEIGV
ncbi:DUF86 domain-containing protein [Candidatus Binatia bacterium]|nr:DUF86 domain-containing protein [Candidatus Binatia bacterium]